MSESTPVAPAGVFQDAHLALWNALKLAGSLLATWTVALAVRFLLPRVLGPEQYGVYTFAEAFAASFFVLANLGIDTYVQKELPLRTGHASEFFGGILALRVLLGGALLAVMAVLLHAGGQPEHARWLVYLFALGQLLFICNATFAAMLQAQGSVGGLSIAQVVAKVLWGAGILLAVTTHLGLFALAGAFTFAEAFKAATLMALCRKHLSLRVRIDADVSRRVLVASVPYLVTTVTTTLFGRLDDALLGFLANDKEVGWFGVASNLSQLALLMTPLIGSVLLPLFARVRARSQEELDRVLRRSLEVVLMIAVPASLALGVGADVWVRVAGGPEFAPAAVALRLLSPVFVLTYVAMLCADCLYVEGRSWRVTWICIGGLVVNASLNVLLIRPMLATLGPGGAGVGAAVATMATEAFTCGLFVAAMGKRVFDARLVSTVARLVGVCVAVVLLDRVLARLGPARLVIDALAYCGLAIACGAVRIAEIREFASSAASVRRSTA